MRLLLRYSKLVVLQRHAELLDGDQRRLEFQSLVSSVLFLFSPVSLVTALMSRFLNLILIFEHWMPRQRQYCWGHCGPSLMTHLRLFGSCHHDLHDGHGFYDPCLTLGVESVVDCPRLRA